VVFELLLASSLAAAPGIEADPMRQRINGMAHVGNDGLVVAPVSQVVDLGLLSDGA